MSQEIQKTAPNAVTALVLGICSLLFGCFFVGLVCGIVGLVLANKGVQIYRQSPESYSGYGMLNAGRIMSIIGIVFSALYVFYYIIAIGVLGGTGLAFFNLANLL